MPRRLLLLATASLTACAAGSYYAVFPPAVPGTEGQRAAGDGFSLVVPQGFERQGDDATGTFRFRETPPDNGENRLFRIVAVEPVAAVADDDPAAIAEQGLALLRARAAGDGLEVRETGSTKLADRDCPFLVGRLRGPAAGWYFDTLQYYVPGDERSLALSFLIPEGQLAASRDAFAATAATLRTTLGMPKPGAAGRMLWHADHHLGLRLPADWEPQADAQGALAVYLHKDGLARCDVVRETNPAGFDLDRLLAGYEHDRAGNLQDLVLVGTQWRKVGGERALRFLSAYRDDGDTIVVDDLFAATGPTLYRVMFRVPATGFATLRPVVERAIGSVRLE